MTITQALALRVGQRLVLLHPEQSTISGRVVKTGRRVWIMWDNGKETCNDHRYMHYIHVLAETITTREEA